MKLLKRIVLSFVLLYTYNLLAIYVNLIIPINIITVALVTFLGIPGFIVLVIYKTLL
ncbi:MAG: pro-sigmaK processing inhibitor BofA family protein [Bacilli bacterium]|nr:pro-sigmaK processing inhibitor BofA family protein [Bacilli bacterium]